MESWYGFSFIKHRYLRYNVLQFTLCYWRYPKTLGFLCVLSLPCYSLKSLRPSDAYMCRQPRPSLVQIMACRLAGPSHYLNQCLNIVNWTLGNKLQWNFNRNWNIFIQENALENVVCRWQAFCLGHNVLKLWMFVWFTSLGWHGIHQMQHS